jgi:HAD superfamily hydrolase (TIGR01509 family)
VAGVTDARIPTSPEAVQRLLNAYVEPILTLPPRLGADVVRTLEDVRALGAKIGLISNTGRAPGVTLRQMLQNYGVLKYFDTTTFSNEIGYRKPHPKIFKQAASGLGINTSRILHVGDNPEADFQGARQAGMKAVLFEPELHGVSEWRPDSMFALSRRHKYPPRDIIEHDSRISTLRDVPYFVQRFMKCEY